MNNTPKRMAGSACTLSSVDNAGEYWSWKSSKIGTGIKEYLDAIAIGKHRFQGATQKQR